MKLAPGLHRGSDVVNVYLVEDAAGVTIVDAGLPGHWRELEQELTQLGRSLDDVRGIVLTHGDSDHIGFAERLRQQKGIVVRVHELDAARLAVRSKAQLWLGTHQGASADEIPVVQRATAASVFGRCARSRHLPTAMCSTCPGRRRSSTFRGTHPAASPCTYRRWTRCLSATP